MSFVRVLALAHTAKLQFLLLLFPSKKHLYDAHAWLEMDGEKIGESEDVNGIFRALAGHTLP